MRASREQRAVSTLDNYLQVPLPQTKFVHTTVEQQRNLSELNNYLNEHLASVPGVLSNRAATHLRDQSPAQHV